MCKNAIDDGVIVSVILAVFFSMVFFLSWAGFHIAGVAEAKGLTFWGWVVDPSGYDWIAICVGGTITAAYYVIGVPCWIDSLYKNKPYFRHHCH